MTKNVSVPEGYKKTELGMIPEEWGIVQIDQLANINRESRDPTKNSEESFYYIDIDAVENGTGLIKNPKRLFGKEAPSRARRVIHKDDVIMSTVRPYHKAFALVPQLYENQICSTGFAVLSCGGNLDPKYLLQFLFSDKVIDQCTSMMAGGQYPALNTTQVSKIKITAPSLPEQQKIASILSKVDEQIEQTEQIIEKTEILKKGLMQKLLTKGIGHTKFKKTELGEIPEEWEIKRFDDVIEKKQLGVNIKASTKNEGTILIKMGNLNLGSFNFEKLEKIDETDIEKYRDYKLNYGDFLFNTRNTPQLVGKSATWKFDEIVAIFNSNIMRIYFKPIYDSFWANYYFSSTEGWKSLKSISKGTTSVGAIYSKDLVRLTIPVPPLPEQQKIVSVLSKVDSQIQDNQNYLSRLQELKKGLMQDLLTGKVRVCV
ncbi:hypothetical protein EO98_18025 [Methanosarcina sp. 2.H.T.1A.6]|uniref:restriction endonuclease subunit S n=1 Tax=unclassified Methanosarcina TaxID=2644672 RepID=UPI00062216FE|nr:MULTISPECIES: restriction endonuclease subunit S [unclassified Methanosarcina]KKG15668.1 hypothetical protein EO94_01235 [Methanosarcina sp. 2.H.T.1A.3]KKG18922.1 hypothetical protein EO97_09240 [Methanosarcina sp. 2.H.T.1A.15]KKG24639.1 hypothetical protein EO98_18025 [Methanosarcina sp. 2.H.T.1A.6]KKG25763.1 hypothetical protein EO96_19215 [Methanosarcina sp. 2.H.T.1A.8]